MKKSEISRFYRHCLRKRINGRNQKRLKNSNFSVIAQNCVGGVILHELGQRFNTPTINLFFSAADFLRFLSDLHYYLGLPVIECESEYSYPVGKIGDLTIHFMHYGSFEEAKNKWEERIQRINFDNLYIMMVQGKDCDDQMVQQFDNLPFTKKVIFTAKNYPNIKSAVHIEGSELNNYQVKDLCQYKSKFSGKRLIDDFDYVEFLNS